MLLVILKSYDGLDTHNSLSSSQRDAISKVISALTPLEQDHIKHLARITLKTHKHSQDVASVIDVKSPTLRNLIMALEARAS